MLYFSIGVKQHAPNVSACIHWLCNRQREKWQKNVDSSISVPEDQSFNITITRADNHGQKYAIYVACLNHCLRDIASVGLKNYINKNKTIGNWSENEATYFTNNQLIAMKILIDERLRAYHKVSDLRSSTTFKRILQSKIDKNENYKTLITGYLEHQGLNDSAVTKFPNQCST